MTTSSAEETPVDQLKTKIQQRQARVGIIGLGYVGLPLALLYSEQKFQVTGFDIDARKVDTLAKGGSYIYRIAAEEVQAAKKHGFSATSDYAQLTAMDAIIICVPTPLNEYHEPDLSYITDTTHLGKPLNLARITVECLHEGSNRSGSNASSFIDRAEHSVP